MSIFVTKVLSLFVHPLSLGLVLVVVGSFLWPWRRFLGPLLLVGGVLVLWIPSAPLFSDWLQGTLEARYPPTPVDSVSAADAIVILGGSVGVPRPPRVYPNLNDAADRVWHAARLYRAGKASLIRVPIPGVLGACLFHHWNMLFK